MRGQPNTSVGLGSRLNQPLKKESMKQTGKTGKSEHWLCIWIIK